MTDTAKETADVLTQVLQEYGPKIRIQYNSKILVSDANVAKAVYAATETTRNSFGPEIEIATYGEATEDVSSMEKVSTKPLESLEMDVYTHSIFGLAGEDPKFILKGLRWMIHALQPKGIAIVTSLREESKAAEGDDGQATVGLEDKMMYQSKGKIQKLSDVLEYAGFERGKVRSHSRTTEVGGKKKEAEVVS